MDLKGNTILITGGGSGIGLALAKAFASRVNTVIICGRSASRLEKAKKETPGLVPITCDIANEEDQRKLVHDIMRDFPQLNMLINNAAIQHQYDWADGKDHTRLIEEEVTINFLATLKLTDRLLPLLMRQHASAIVNVSSALARVPKQSAPIYCATKAGLHNFTRALRYQLEKTPVKVFEVMPPAVDTPMNKGSRMSKMKPEQVARETLRGIKSDKFEMHIGATKLLFALNRLLPSLAARIVRHG